MRDRNLRYGLIGLASITGVIHLYVGYLGAMDTLLMAGLGFLGGAALFGYDLYRNLVATAAIPYTLSQFVFYYQVYGFSFNTLAAIDKIVQAVFVAGCIYFLSENVDSLSELTSR